MAPLELLPLQWLRTSIASQIEKLGGRHDEADIYGGPAGDPGLVGGPDSMSWRIHADLASISLAGPAAILMEVLEPSVMAGVEEHSSYRSDPLDRARNTLGYVLRTTFGSTEAATAVVDQVKHIHGYVSGVRPDGVPYEALDPELIAWVHTCIPWAIMTAYDRCNTPLTDAEKDQYLSEQAIVGRMGGAAWVPETAADLEDYVESMRGRLAVNEQTRSFQAFLTGETGGPDAAPRHHQLQQRLDLRLSMSLMPDWARHLTGTWHPEWFQRTFGDPRMRLQARMVRWAYPELPCARIATARASAAVSAAPRSGVSSARGTQPADDPMFTGRGVRPPPRRARVPEVAARRE